MTAHQEQVAQALARCSMLPGTPAKRFIRDMDARSRLNVPPPLTEKQAAYLDELAHRFRRQMPPSLVPVR